VWAGLTRQGRMMSDKDPEEQEWLVLRGCPVAIWCGSPSWQLTTLSVRAYKRKGENWKLIIITDH